MKLIDRLEEIKKTELEVDEDKFLIVERFLISCVAKGILKSRSPLFTFLLHQAMVYSKKDV